MSAYDNVVTGKLKLKGKALDVKGGIKKKKKHYKRYEYDQSIQVSTGGDAIDQFENVDDDNGKGGVFDHMTPAERRYMEQAERLQAQRLAKMAKKSHRDRVQEFNQYLANLSEHYDIPKVGPG
ncbi:PREDICTED: protein FAM32A-like [Fragaria vesca subsp. vesca]|uniref:protein FAM32A-like n=1 Tax=Fragaria vesca subsp. vesca TaxID=101020 RepID=UPI0002C32200|nr:PREDICTED: protein FAM32A-like [Fragaria vesca subsp. vesca]